MATSTSSFPLEQLSQPLELPQWQQDEFSQKMEQWRAEEQNHDSDNEHSTPEVLSCFFQNPKAAFHFQSFGTIVSKWQGESTEKAFDGLSWLRKEEPKIALRLKELMLSMENDLQNGKFPSLACSMEYKNLNRAVWGQSVPTGKITFSNSLMNHLHSLEMCLKTDKQSRWWELYHDSCRNLYYTLQDTSGGLQELLDRHHDHDSLSDAQEPVEAPGDGKTGAEQNGLRRRRPDIPAQVPSSGGGVQRLARDSKDHTPVEAMFLLTKALKVAFQQIPFLELRDALWKDDRAPVSMSLIFTSISSVLVGVALATHNRFKWSSARIDDGFFTLLSETIIQLFSLYVLLLPFLRGQEPHLRGVWFCLSIGLSIIFSVVSCIVYAFSWHASAVLSFGGTLASMITSLLLVQSIDKGNKPEKESDDTNVDV